MTGEELTELFFTKVKGWEWKERWETLPPDNYCWHDSDDKERGVELPPLHTSLDLQEERVWPELHGRGFYEVHFELLDGGIYKCWIPNLRNAQYDQTINFGTGKTKPLAQLEASLKALGVL